MPRIARAVALAYPHHVTQRGNYKQPVFEDKDDFIRYKSWLQDYIHKFSLQIWAYCLMSNHVHFICIPQTEETLSKTFNTLHMRYSQYFNRKMDVKGHLWQGRFFSCVLDERHLYAAIRYVENNPVRANIVERAENYIWSSSRGHILRGSDSLLSGDCYLEEDVKDWRSYLNEKDDIQMIKAIKKNTMTGRPCGNDTFINDIEKLLGRELKAKAWGRPRK
jgi:putative transposase